MRNFNLINSVLLVVVFGLMVSCAEEELDPTSTFSKIYDHSGAEIDYRPIDIVETNSGYYILAERALDDSDFDGIQIIQLDEEGRFVAERTPDDDYVAAVAEFVSVGDHYYFFAMDERTYETVLFDFGDTISVMDVNPVVSNSYPLAANISIDSSELILLTYRSTTMQTTIRKVDFEANAVEGVEYSTGVGSDVEDDIINHFVNPEKYKLPFFCGELSTGQVYFNGFYNYSLSLVFSSFGSEPDGVLQGQSTIGGLRYAMPVLGSDFALFGFQYNDNYLIPQASIGTNALASSIDLMTGDVSEFASGSDSDIKVWDFNDSRYVIIAGETNNGQIALYFYDYLEGTLAGIEKIGYLNNYQLSSLELTKDNGLLVLGSTYVSGRFERTFLKKYSEEMLASIVK